MVKLQNLQTLAPRSLKSCLRLTTLLDHPKKNYPIIYFLKRVSILKKNESRVNFYPLSPIIVEKKLLKTSTVHEYYHFRLIR